MGRPGAESDERRRAVPVFHTRFTQGARAPHARFQESFRPPTTERTLNKYPLLSKLLLIGFLMALLAIPLALVRDVIAERSAHRQAATQEVALSLIHI